MNRLGYRTVLPCHHPSGLPTVGLVTVALRDDGAVLHGVSDRIDALLVAVERHIRGNP